MVQIFDIFPGTLKIAKLLHTKGQEGQGRINPSGRVNYFGLFLWSPFLRGLHIALVFLILISVLFSGNAGFYTGCIGVEDGNQREYAQYFIQNDDKSALPISCFNICFEEVEVEESDETDHKKRPDISSAETTKILSILSTQKLNTYLLISGYTFSHKPPLFLIFKVFRL